MTNTPHNPTTADLAVVNKIRPYFEAALATAIGASDFATLDPITRVHSTILGISHRRWLAVCIQIANLHGDTATAAALSDQAFKLDTDRKA